MRKNCLFFVDMMVISNALNCKIDKLEPYKKEDPYDKITQLLVTLKTFNEFIVDENWSEQEKRYLEKIIKLLKENVQTKINEL